MNKIFNPKTIAIIGAKPDLGSVGGGLMRNVLSSKRKIFPVNPNRKKVLGLDCFSSILEIKDKIDLAIIAVPAKIVLQIVEQCCKKKVGGIIIISSGFSERDNQGKILQEKIKIMVQKAKIPLVGPNCLGVLRPSVLLNASFAPCTPKKGRIAFISQSGALIDSVIDKSSFDKYGFSVLISCGNQADLSISEYLEWLEKDKETKVICLYVEGLKNGRNFIKIAKKISKPIIAIKAGKTDFGKKAIFSHTASLAGDYNVFRAALRQSGIIEVETVEELFDKAKALAWQPRCKNKIAILTNGGGCGVLAVDYCEKLGVKIALPPVDILGDAKSDQYQKGVEDLLGRKDVYGLIIIQTLQIMTEVEKNAKIIVKATKKWPDKPIVCAFLGGKLTKPGVDILENNKIPNYNDVAKAVQAMDSLINKNN